MAYPEYSRGLWPESGEPDSLAYGLGWDNMEWYPFCQSDIQALVKGGDTLYYHAGLVVLPEYDMAAAVVSSGGVSTYDQLAANQILIAALAEEGVSVPKQADVDMSLLSGEAERALLKQIAQFCEEIKLAARDYDPQPHQPLPHRSGGGVPQILRRLPHQGRGEAGAAGPAEAGGYHPCGAEKCHDPHRLQRPGENVRGPCISNFCRYGRSLHRKGTPCGLAAGVFFRLRMDAAPVAASHPSEKISPNGRSILCLHGTGSTIHIDKTDSLWEGR